MNDYGCEVGSPIKSMAHDKLMKTLERLQIIERGVLTIESLEHILASISFNMFAPPSVQVSPAVFDGLEKLLKSGK